MRAGIAWTAAAVLAGALGFSGCGADDEAQGGLALSDREQSYENLLGGEGIRARIEPGEPECSVLERLESTDPSFRMLVGRAPLAIGQRCAVRRWIANGAKR